MLKKLVRTLSVCALSCALLCACESADLQPKQEAETPQETPQDVVINSFDTQADGAGCGWKGNATNGSQKNKVEWLESFEKKTGVLKMIGSKGGIYRNFYFDASAAWTEETLHAYITENDTANWDYIVVTMWISSVTTNPIENVRMDDYMQTLYVNEWQELKIPKSYFDDNQSTHKSVSALAETLTGKNEYLFYIRTQDDADTSNVMIYVDDIRFERDGE